MEILLIGTAHDYSNYPIQDFSEVKNKIRKFKPDAFFGEFRLPEEEKTLMDYWCKSFNNERIDRLKKARAIPEQELSQVIEQLKTNIAQNPQDWKLKIDIAHAYFLSQDVANAFFNLWQVFNYLSESYDEEVFKYSKLVIVPELVTIQEAIAYYTKSEYHYIAFPMMMEFGFKEIYPMDCQTYDLNWNAANTVFEQQMEIFKQDTLMSNTETFRDLEKMMEKGFDKHRENSKTNKLTEYLNTDESNYLSSTFDFWIPEMYDLPYFPKEPMMSALHWWQMRNEGMCQNTISGAKKLGVNKTVVIVGANHRKCMQDIFKKIPNITVRNINEM